MTVEILEDIECTNSGNTKLRTSDLVQNLSKFWMTTKLSFSVKKKKNINHAECEL